MNIMIFTDNLYMYESFKKIIILKKLNQKYSFTYACSPENKLFNKYSEVEQVKIKDVSEKLIASYQLIISCHSKQIFPAELVNSVRCINIHPGLNPYNRGWYPQVFSIINKMPLGATIHEMDEEIDHGDIIVQKEIKIQSYDTSLSAYNRVLEAEVELLSENIENIISKRYLPKKMQIEGNYNSRKDFDKLCKLDLNENMTLSEAIDKLRALTHREFSNAYFYDNEGQKIYVHINLEKIIG